MVQKIKQTIMYEDQPSQVETFSLIVEADKPAAVWCKDLGSSEVIKIEFLTKGNSFSQAIEADWLVPVLNTITQELTSDHNMVYIELPGIYRISTPASTASTIRLGVNQ